MMKKSIVPPSEAEERKSRPVHEKCRTFRILVAENNAVCQTVTVMQLQKLGYEADVVGNGLEVLDALGRTHYDLILMDCRMPEMDGYEATRKIRAMGNAVSRIRIVALTACAMRGDREACLEAGMDDYISKPTNIRDLEQAIAKIDSSH